MEEPQDDVEQPHAEEKRVEASTHVETSRDGRKHTKEVDGLMHDAREKWEHPHHSTGKGGHQIGPLATWL